MKYKKRQKLIKIFYQPTNSVQNRHKLKGIR
jgi:hypothetical protein